MSPETLEYHHGKHHKAYVTKTNELIANDRQLSDASLIDVVRQAKLSGNNKLFNNSAQLWNHSFFWQCLAPSQGQKPSGRLAQLIQDGFGGEDALLQKLQEEAVNHFSNGWAWLVLDRDEEKESHRSTIRHASRARGDAAAVHARCVGTCLLHRLSKRASAVSLSSVLSTIVNWDFVAQEPRRREASIAPIRRALKRVRPSLLLEPVAGPEHPGDHRHADGDDRQR